MDFFLGGAAHGSVASMLLNSGFDTNVMRPFIDDRYPGRSFVNQVINGEEVAVPVQNNTGFLRAADWQVIDRAIVKAAKLRLRGVADLRSRDLEYVIPDGMGRYSLLTETQSDVREASVDMDGLTDTRSDRPIFGLTTLPLPLIHADFNLPTRLLAASRNGGSALDTSTIELSARRVIEQAESMLFGTAGTLNFGGNAIQGYTNYSGRILQTLTNPALTAWTPQKLIDEVLQMQGKSITDLHYGPWLLYFSTDWRKYLEEDYKTSASASSVTLRQRIKAIDGIVDVLTADYLPAQTAILVQLTPEVVRMVIGLELVCVQWESHGGMQQNFKVMAIYVPQLRADANGNTGIVHGLY